MLLQKINSIYLNDRFCYLFNSSNMAAAAILNFSQTKKIRIYSCSEDQNLPKLVFCFRFCQIFIFNGFPTVILTVIRLYKKLDWYDIQKEDRFKTSQMLKFEENRISLVAATEMSCFYTNRAVVTSLDMMISQKIISTFYTYLIN